MDFIISIASKIAEYAVAPVGRQLGYLIFYKSNLDNLKIQVQNLEAAKDTMQHSVDAAKRNGEEIEDNVKNWLKEVDDTIADAKKFHDNEGREEVGCSSQSFPNPWTRYQVSRNANKMARGIVDLAEKKFENISYLPPSQGSINPSARGYLSLESRTSMLNDIVQTLTASNEYIIGLYGMGGVGKTTLIKELAWKVEQDGSFGEVVVATVTNSPDVKRIQGEIADKLGLHFDKETQAGRATRLRDRIRKEKTILVILDDIWEKLDLLEVGVPFGDDQKGCKLLLTSRDLNVLKSEMGTQKDFKLEVLSKDESWSLFENMAGDVVKDSNLQPIALEVAERCAGLPLLMTTMAKGLKNKNLCSWKDALKQLTRFHQKELPAKVSSAIELSYNNLATAELKSLFLLIGSFGQTDIWTRYLLIYFWGLGLYEQPDTLANARNRLFNLVTDLKSSCLLLEGERDHVRMHDIVHEVAHKIASRDHPIFAVKVYNELKEWPQMEWLKKCHRIFLPYNRFPDLPKSLECPKLEILVLVSLNQLQEVPNEFFGGMKELKVLYLGGMDCTKSLPLSLCQLTKLRALYLRECLLEDIAIVAELKNLEILGLEFSKIKELPAVIGRLSRLRLLDLRYCSVSTIAAQVISSLISLEELYTTHTSIQWEVEGRGNKSPSNHATLGELRNLHHLAALDILIQDPSILLEDLLIFKKLERYVILIGGGWTWSSRYEISRTLKLNQGTITSTHLDHGVRFLLDSVEDLYLSQLKGVNNVLYQLNGKGFPQLKHLSIQNSMQVQYIIDSKEWRHPLQAFPNLESLILHNLSNMKRICNGPLPIQSFTKLKVIKVKYCNSLENLLLDSLARDLPQLLEVEISKCKTMSEIIVKDDTQIDMIKLPKLISLTLDCLPMLAGFFSKSLTVDRESRSVDCNDDSTIPVVLFDEKISFPSLEHLKLSSINSRKIWADKLIAESCIQKLTSLTINGCHNIKYLFSFSMAQGLINLQHLDITGCGMLEEIVVIEGKTGNLPSSTEQLLSEVAIFPNLETLEISHMDNLNSIWPDQLSPKSFSRLIKMEISICPKLLNVIPSWVLNYLHNLETLLVTNCATLEVIFEMKGLKEGIAIQGNLAIHLETLTLENLPMLKHIWSDDPCGSLQFQNLCRVMAANCKNLSHLFPLSIAKELLQLQELDIVNCGLENIVAKDEMVEEAPKFVFPQLTTLRFWNLAQFRSFYPGIHTVDCYNIIKADVYQCHKLEVFKPKSPSLQDKVQVIGQTIFSFEKTGSSSKKTRVMPGPLLTQKENMPSEEDEEETVKPLLKKKKTSTPKDGRGHGYGTKYFKGRSRMKIVNRIPPRSNLGYKKKKSKDDKQSTLSKFDIASHETSKQIVETSNKDNEILDSGRQFVEFLENNLSKEAPAPPQLNVDPNIHDLSVNDHACGVNKGKTIMDLNRPLQHDESDEDPLVELESILSGIHKSSPKASNPSTLFRGDIAVKEALYNLECSLKYSLESLLSNEELCCKLNIALNCLEEAHDKLPVDVIRLVDIMKSSIGNLFKNFKTTQKVINDHVERLDKKNKLIQYMGEAKERQGQLNGKMLEGKTKVDHLDEEIARLNGQIQVLVEQKTSIETKQDKLKKVLIKCEGEKKKLKDEARELVKESKEIVLAIDNYEATYKDALSKKEKMKEKWESFQKDMFINIKSSSNL